MVRPPSRPVGGRDLLQGLDHQDEAEALAAADAEDAGEGGSRGEVAQLVQEEVGGRHGAVAVGRFGQGLSELLEEETRGSAVSRSWG
ncbi:MAG: hypothetical protein K6V97_09540 [Actinomycetia bacterium]|nr:hypothetical protein [Actinomycetes bacterium]